MMSRKSSDRFDLSEQIADDLAARRFGIDTQAETERIPVKRSSSTDDEVDPAAETDELPCIDDEECEVSDCQSRRREAYKQTDVTQLGNDQLKHLLLTTDGVGEKRKRKALKELLNRVRRHEA